MLISEFSDEVVAVFKASGEFDEQWYLNEYPDVAKSGIEPARHYLWIGRKLGRRSKPAGSRNSWLHNAPSQTSPSKSHIRALSILFIDGSNGTSSTHYRINRIADGLIQMGWDVIQVKGDDIKTIDKLPSELTIAVFFRAPFWEPYTELVDNLRTAGTIIVYDIDDFVFDEDIMPYIDGVRFLTEDQKQGYARGMKAYRQFILNSDICTAATTYLCDKIKQLGVPADRVRNTISHENISFFKAIEYKKASRPSPFVVGYYSGTKTHQADFSVVAPSLIRFMQENSDVIFRIVGDFVLNDFPELDKWQCAESPEKLPRVTRVGLMPHDAMMRDQLSCDVIVAPLEVDNPFCEAKSELKFFEAALAKVPVIASATRTFREATDNGRFAMLAVNTDDWYRALLSIYNDYNSALTRAEHAYDYVLKYYAPSAAIEEAVAAYLKLADRHPSLSTATQQEARSPSDLAVVLPDITGPSGGHRKIFTVCDALIRAGHSVTLYFMSGRPLHSIRMSIEQYFGDLACELRYFDGNFDDHDIAICTSWSSAYEFRKVNFQKRVLYFVQDFEPMFNAVGSEYMKALASYNMGFEIICYGSWVAAKLHHEMGILSKVIPFTLDKEVYAIQQWAEIRDVDILVFGRPSQDRRCFSLIIEGLRLLKLQNPDLSIALFGEDHYPDFGFEITNLGSFSDINELAKLYRRTKIGICYSTTNPSQLGYEMLACGACLIDIRVKFSELNFGGENFVLYCEGTPEGMRDACNSLLSNHTERERRQSLALKFVSDMKDDEELGRAFLRAAGLDL